MSLLIKYLSMVSAVRLSKGLSDEMSLMMVLCMRMLSFWCGLTSSAESRYAIFLRYGLGDWQRLMGRMQAKEVSYPRV